MSARIDRHEQLDIDGVTLHALVRGNAEGPVVLLLQAGPGFPMIHEADALEARLELEATHRVVYLDQRGTGLSLAPSGPFTVEQLVDDALAVAHALRDRLDVSAVDLVGFSLGGTVALLAAERQPQCIRSVVAVGPDIDMRASEAFAWDFVREQALRRGSPRLEARIARVENDTSKTKSEQFLARVRLVSDFGGIAIGQRFFGILTRTLYRLFSSRSYSVRDAFAALSAMQTTQAKLLDTPSFAELDIRSLNRLDVPVTVFQGRLDVAAPPMLAAAFVEALEAPMKKLVWFDRCAHMPHFEAPNEFRSALFEALAIGTPSQ